MNSRILLFSSVTALACSLIFAKQAEARDVAAAADGASSAAAAADAAAAEADPADAQAANEAIIVTGSRIQRTGFTAPTPVTVINSATLQREAQTTVGEYLSRLPQFGSGSTALGGGHGSTGGRATVNLRNMGTSRTLVLLDGMRVPAVDQTNTIDLNLLPSALIGRIDVVTGGASAAYGSDAVAGVVNLVLDRSFTGLKGDVEYGNSWKMDYLTRKADLAFGTGFNGGRGHLLLSASYWGSPNAVQGRDRAWNKFQALMPNPAYTATNGQPKLITVPNVGFSTWTRGGVIRSGPLANTRFVGNGVPVAFQPGIIESGILQYGGDAERTSREDYSLAGNQEGFNLFGYLSHEIGSSITARMTLSYAGTSGSSNAASPAMIATILADNAFLPASIRTKMQASNISSFALGTTNENIGGPHNGKVTYLNERIMKRGTFSLEGKLGKTWSWNLDYGHGEVRFDWRWPSMPYRAFFNLAVDAVVNPATGQIVCRSTLTNPANGCVPLNVFGENVQSAAAKAYVSRDEFARFINKLDTVDLVLRGEPFSTWAGPVSVAVGGHYRKESTSVDSDDLSQTRGFFAGNVVDFFGAVSVKEGFGEVVVPLAVDAPFAKNLDLNAAVRVADYSTSGAVTAWKVGLTDKLTDDIKLRGTISRDIRAPTVSDLFTTTRTTSASGIDPFTGQNLNFILSTVTGNPGLKPEHAVTKSVGLVYSPGWLSGLTASVDWYSINVKGALATYGAQDTLNLCFAGETSLCPNIIRNAQGSVTEIVSRPMNTNVEKTSGIDFELAYRRPFLGGDIEVQALGSYTIHSYVTINNKLVDIAGSLRPDAIDGNGQPRFKSRLSATYTSDAVMLGVQSRIIGGGKLLSYWGPTDVDRNDVPAIAYVDIRGSYTFANIPARPQLYFAVDNIFDQTPPVVPFGSGSGNATIHPATRIDTYDTVGRAFRVGVRVKF